MGERLQQMLTDILSRTSLGGNHPEAVARSLQKERTRIPIEDIVEDMRNKYIRIMPLADLQGSRGRIGFRGLLYVHRSRT
jgi:hypothetical protein